MKQNAIHDVKLTLNIMQNAQFPHWNEMASLCGDAFSKLGWQRVDGTMDGEKWRKNTKHQLKESCKRLEPEVEVHRPAGQQA